VHDADSLDAGGAPDVRPKQEGFAGSRSGAAKPSCCTTRLWVLFDLMANRQIRINRFRHVLSDASPSTFQTRQHPNSSTSSRQVRSVIPLDHPTSCGIRSFPRLSSWQVSERKPFAAGEMIHRIAIPVFMCVRVIRYPVRSPIHITAIFELTRIGTAGQRFRSDRPDRAPHRLRTFIIMEDKFLMQYHFQVDACPFVRSNGEVSIHPPSAAKHAPPVRTGPSGGRFFVAGGMGG
jgi:hypothetical protein